MPDCLQWASHNQLLAHGPRPLQEGQAADGSLLHDPDVDTAKLHEVVVPISTACQRLTPGLLHSFFQLHAAGRECVMLALVDSDGTVAVNRMHLGIVAPLEGPSDAQVRPCSPTHCCHSHECTIVAGCQGGLLVVLCGRQRCHCISCNHSPLTLSAA